MNTPIDLINCKGFDPITLISNEMVLVNGLTEKDCIQVLKENISSVVVNQNIHKFNSELVLEINRVNKSREKKELPSNWKDGWYCLLNTKNRHLKSYTTFKGLLKYCTENKIKIIDVKLVNKNSSCWYGALEKTYSKEVLTNG